MDFDFPQMDTKTRSEKGVDMTVRDLAGKPLLNAQGDKIILTLLGPDSAKYRAMQRDEVRDRLRRQSAGEPDLSPEEQEQGIIDFLVGCTIDWKGVTAGGKPVPFSPEAARQFYQVYPAIRDQVDAFTANRTAFSLASKRN